MANKDSWEPIQKGQPIPRMQGIANTTSPNGGATVPTLQRANPGGKSTRSDGGNDGKK